jgi:tRNA nucleotidyltransferase (CCA-adding enzyme)
VEKGCKKMNLILTHEQADFDAIASLLAARLLDPEALAVLPRRVNRNVRAYLTLYGDRLPFVEFDDLPRTRIKHLTLVDTQSLVSVRGYNRHTKVHVVDHHPADPDLDPSWTAHIDEIGATTSLLVEALQESGIELDVVTATILMLGIYEDTGSLSYSGTTPRDVRAAAWLLDCGANITIVADFLNHPLSSEQRVLYERLFDAAEAYDFHGLSVVVACGSTEGMVDEVSTLAHKLRDLFDPDGLFVLVALNAGVQMVARSNTASLDVGKVAEYFGGGGHSQAAAALIHDRDLEQICEELLKYLPTVIEPARTVGEIMSRAPQLLNPEDNISDAAERMQRFGHEGYPVVDDGHVVGLLTRRAVDRAMAHGMKKGPISSIMEAGDLVVYPTDSVQHLQRVMIRRGWGQVPVADPETGDIVGIVTRTDLLKTIGSEADEPAVASLVDRLENALPRVRLDLLRLVARQAEKHDDALYIVGGFVRDLLLGAASGDFDLVVEVDAIVLAHSLAADFGGRISSHRRFGTAKWWLDRENPSMIQALGESADEVEKLPQSLDFVTARTEFYSHPTALPSIERGSIKLDLHRRDFTINTLALRLDGRFYGQLLDHWGGGRDLRDGLIRVLHSISFVDDPTRILRAVRLEQRLGFEIDNRTLELLRQALPLLDRVSGERIHHEMIQIFNEVRLPEIMRRIQEINILEAIHPALEWDAWLEARFEKIRAFTPSSTWDLSVIPTKEFLYDALLCFRLPADHARDICDRLHFSAVMSSDILEANRLGRELPTLVDSAKPSELVAQMEGSREGALVATWLALENVQARKVVDRYLTEWRKITPRTNGNVLRDLGLPPGPTYRHILWTLRSAWIDGVISNPDEEEALLQRLITEALDNG